MQLARGYFERAAELTEDQKEAAGLLEQAAACAFALVQMPDVIALCERSSELYAEAGNLHGGARASARIGEALWVSDRPDEGADRMEAALAVLADAEPDHDLALLHATLGKVRFFLGELDKATAQIEIALEIAEALWLPDVLSEALNTKALILGARGGHEEELALLRHALQLALDNDVATAAMRAYNNLSYVTMNRDRYEEARRYQEEGIALGTRLGFRGQRYFLRAHLEINRFMRGEWDELRALVDELSESTDTAFYGGTEGLAAPAIWYLQARGEIGAAELLCERFVGDPEVGDTQTRSYRVTLRGIVAEAGGRHEEALALARTALENIPTLGLYHDVMRDAFGLALEAAVALGDVDAADEILRMATEAPPGAIGPFFRAQADRYAAVIAVLRDDDQTASSRFRSAVGLLRELGTPFHLAAVLLEQAEWLAARGRSDEARPMLEEAQTIFEGLNAIPYLERVSVLAPELTPA
jgi:tetratricopeptide (TPR) repeat protein